MTDRPVKILALAGSYRTGSLHQALLTTVRRSLPAGVEWREFDLRKVPFYDGDVEAAGDPEPVVRLKEAVREADAVLFAVPEYNGGIPAVLKNGIDWASRRYPESPLRGKLVAVIGASPGRSGTRAAQEHLWRVLRRVGCVSSGAPGFTLERARDVIEDGEVVAADVKAQLVAVVDVLVEAVRTSADCGSSSAAG